MDIIYDRALVTAGLHDGWILKQEWTDAIRLFTQPFDQMTAEALSFNTGVARPLFHILDFLRQVSADRWYTRAWVIQGAISAGSRLVLAFRRASGIPYPSFLCQHEQYDCPRHSLDSKSQNYASDLVCIPVDDFRQVVQRAKVMMRETTFFALGGPLARFDDMDIVEAAEKLHLVLVERKSSTVRFHMHAAGSFGVRQRVEAATALSLLNTRACRDEQDRIAIVVNMCNYEIRLSTEAIAKNCKSLQVALLALSLFNGDLSLLVPEAYSSLRSQSKKINRQTPAWLSPFDTDSCYIDHSKIRSHGGIRVFKRTQDLAGLQLVSYL